MPDVTPRAALESLASRLATAPPSGDSITASIEGINVTLRFVLRESGSTSTKTTEIAVKSAGLPGPFVKFLIDMRPEYPFETEAARQGTLRDLKLGDAAFDAAFIVEAAPEDVIRELLDRATRAEMIALLPIHVFSSTEHAIEITREGWVDEVVTLERLMRLAVRVAARLGPAGREAADARRRAPRPGGYRDGPPTDDDIRRDRDVDVRALEAQRASRRQRARRIAIALTLIVVVAICALVALLTVWG